MCNCKYSNANKNMKLRILIYRMSIIDALISKKLNKRGFKKL